MSVEKANEVIRYAEMNAADEMTGTGEALIALIGDLQKRVAELEAAR
jgi:hypothetical protein